MVPKRRTLPLVTLTALVVALVAAPPVPVFLTAQGQAGTPAWVARSNEHAKVMLDMMARLSPENAGRTGVEGFDEAITDISPGYIERTMATIRDAGGQLEKRLAAETDTRVRQDLRIMLDVTRQSLAGVELERKYTIPYVNVGETIFQGLSALLDDQVAPARRKAALVRLRKYVGAEPGTTPWARLAEEGTRKRMSTPGLTWPAKLEVERGLADSASYVDGIPKLFEKYGLTGYAEDCATLKTQIAAYDAFVRREILPKARTDFRLPPELYAFRLKEVGVDIPRDQLVKMAHDAFADIQKEMQALAPIVAKERGWTQTGYRDVIRALKQEQLVGDAILPHYQTRLKDLEGIIVREKLVTLPSRPARIRLASEAETAAGPAPNMRPPRLVGNTGEQGEFVLPLNVPTTDGKTLRTDDFTFAAASWTLTAHEARPGHELQFAGMIEAGVSTARAIFSFNSTNVEGWGLYAEKISYPFMPPDGKLISLQFRLLRAARAFLDPELQAGTITPDQALKVLTDDVVVSEAMARQEVDRYTFRMPGQATSYFYGYTRLTELRADVEKTMGPAFDHKALHDFILSQGLLPPALMREVVLERFVKR